MFKRILFFLILNGYNSIINAQQLSLFDVDTSAYPNIKASFYAFEKSGEQIITITKDKTVITENDIAQAVVRVTNPSYQKPKPVSVFLTIDVSASMGSPDYNIKLAKAASKALISIVPLDISECAITSFDNSNYVNTDFTKNKEQLLKAIETLKPSGGTDYNAAFGTPTTGIFDMAKKITNEKIVIFLTDGIGDANEAELISNAKKQGLKIYCITLDMDMPDALKHISEQTGGRYYENITNEDDLKSIFSAIFYGAEGFQPSKIEWIATPTCKTLKNVTFNVSSLNMSYNKLSYNVPQRGLVYLDYSRKFIRFAPSEPNKPNIESFKIKAINGDITVQSFTSINPLYTFPSIKSPLTILKGTEKEIFIEFTSIDNNNQTSKIEIEINKCSNDKVIVKNSIIQQTKSMKSLKLDFPNGNETFYTNSDTLINWSGILPTDQAELFYSSDNGKKWNVIATKQNNNSYLWKLPEQATDSARIRVVYGENLTKSNDGTFSTPQNIFEKKLNTYSGWMIMSPANDLFVSQNATNITVFDFPNGNELLQLPKKGSYAFNDDGSLLYFFDDEDSKVTVYDTKSLTKINEFSSKHQYRNVVGKNGDVYVNNGDNSKHVIYDLLTNERLQEVPKIQGFEPMAVTSNYLMLRSIDTYTGSNKSQIDKKCILYDLTTMSIKCEVKVPESIIHSSYVSRNEKYFIVASWGFSGIPFNVTVFDIETCKELYNYVSNNKNVVTVSVGTELMAAVYKDKYAIIEIATGKVLKEINGDFTTAKISPTDKYAIFGNYLTSYYSLYSIDIAEKNTVASSEDVSDYTFKIVNPTLDIKSMDFGKVALGDFKDNVFNAVIVNPNSCNLKIEDIKLDGINQSSFRLMSKTTPFVIPANQSYSIELHFGPKKPGIHAAQLLVKSGKQIYIGKISGESIAPKFNISTQTIQMGKVLVGLSKDTIIDQVIKNAGSTTIIVSSVKIIGPDITQFSLLSTTGFTLNAGETKSVRLKFSPSKRGIASTQLYFDIKNEIGNKLVNVIGEGVASSIIKLDATVINTRTNKSTTAIVSCIDIDSGREIENESTTGTYSYKLFADRHYLLKASLTGYSMDSTILDLRKPTQDVFIKKDLFITPLNSSLAILNGVILDKMTNLPLMGTAVIREKETLLLVDSISTKSDGLFHVNLQFGKVYNIYITRKDYMSELDHVDLLNVSTTFIVEKKYELSPIIVGQSINLKNIYFVRSKAILLEESYEQLNLLLTLMLENPNLKIELLGHTDNQGDPKLNVKLSQERVEEIKKFLITNNIVQTRISGRGLGGAYPIASNNTEETRKLNRRVEFKIIGK